MYEFSPQKIHSVKKSKNMFVSLGRFRFDYRKAPFPAPLCSFFLYPITQYFLQLDAFLEIKSQQVQSFIFLLIAGTESSWFISQLLSYVHVLIFNWILSLHFHLKQAYTINLIWHSNTKPYLHYLPTPLNKQRWRPAHIMIHLTTK